MVWTILFVAIAQCVGWGQSASQPVVPATPNAALDDRMAETIWRHLEAFSGMGSRVVGYPGHQMARRHVEASFRDLGLKDIQVEEFQRVAPIDEGATLQLADGSTTKLACFWPNLVRTPTTPPEGITGTLFYARDGRPEYIDGVDLSQCIVVLDFDCKDRYILIRSLGARAIVFIEPDEMNRGQATQKVLDAPVNLPRYWLGKTQWQALQPAVEQRSTATIRARMTWKPVKAHNILGRIDGTDPKLADEPIVLTSWYDAASVVPSIAPGAEAACGISTLMWLAEYFRDHPAKRPVWFVALDSHALGQGGIDDFVVNHCMAGRTYENWVSNFIKRVPPQRGRQINPRLIIDLNLSAGTRTLGAFWDGNSTAGTDFHRNSIIKVADVAVARAQQILKAQPDRHTGMAFVNGVRSVRGITWHSYLPTPVMFDSTVALKAKQHAMAIATALDSRHAWDTPLDTLERLRENRGNLWAQARLLTELLDVLLNDATLIDKYTSQNDFRGYYWPINPFVCKANRSKLSDRPVTTEPMPEALVVLRAESRSPWFAGGYATEIGLTDTTGYHVDPLADHLRLYIYGYRLDPTDGSIVYAADRGEEGHGRQSLDVSRKPNGILVMFRCVTMDLYDLADPIRFKGLDSFSVMLPTGGTPQKFGYCWNPRLDPRLCLTLHLQRGTRIRFAAGRGMFGYQYLLLNSTEDNPEGEGWLLDRETPVFFSNFEALKDLRTLNNTRFQRLKEKGIENNLVKGLLERTDRAYAAAEQARNACRWNEFLHAQYEGLGFATTAYPQVKGMARDTVQGVVFYFALLIPFAFFLERLLFGFPDIRKQIAAVGVIFLAVFAIMGVIHPAFQISDSPYVIFLAFIVMALAAIVLSIIVGKFGEQMQELRSSGGEVHRVDVGRISATMAAVMLGISNLRKRRVRTVLTTVTIVLLTFAVLSFTVVSSATHHYHIYRPYTASYQGILFRDRNWLPINHVLQDYVAYAFQGDKQQEQPLIAPRCWYFIERDNDLSLTVRGPDNAKTSVSGALGIVPHEKDITGLDRMLVAGQTADRNWITSPDAQEVLLPSSLARTLRVDPAVPGRDTIQAFGKTWKVVGILDAAALGDFRDLDGESIAPIQPRKGKDSQRFTMNAAREMQLEAESMRSTEVQALQHVDPQNTPIFPYLSLAACGAHQMSIAVGTRMPNPDEDRPKTATEVQLEDLLARSSLLAFVGYDGGTVKAISATGQTGVGWNSGLVVPVIIASLIVLNTMLGSVYERQREISTYSSVGLAPSHIAALFLAESSVFAVIGAFTGYLLGQTVAKVMMSFHVLGGININYSSTAAVLTSVIVMGVVMLSAVYPAKVAARMAVPDVTRRWQFPAPQGDTWRFEFPFTVADWQVLGLFAFLADFFAACAEESVGVFYTRNTCLTRQGQGNCARHQIELDVWLAPYDLGVSQHVVLLAEPTEDERIHRIEMTIVRRSGEHAAWQQRNRAFLAELRRQFLIYRTIPESAKQRWEQKALEQLSLASTAPAAGAEVSR